MICSPFSVDSTYTGPLDFLNIHTRFYNIYRLVLEILLVIIHSSRAIEVSDTLQSKISTLCSRYQLDIFWNIVQLQYVGTETYDSNQMMTDIPLAPSNLNLEFQFKGKLATLTSTVFIVVIFNTYHFFPPMQ